MKKAIIILTILLILIIILAIGLQQRRQAKIKTALQKNNRQEYSELSDPSKLKTTPQAPPATSPKVPSENDYQIGSHDYTLQYDGEIRTYRVHLPQSYNGQTKMALLMGFHGTSGTSAGFAGTTKFSLIADQENFIAVYPQSLIGGNSKQPTKTAWWYKENAPVDDRGFIQALVNELTSNLNIDENKIYATGSSNGAMFTEYLAYTLPGTFAAIATVGGTLGENTQKSPQPTAIVMFNGLLDQTVKYNGAPGVASIPEAFAQWAENNNCQGDIISENIPQHNAVQEEYTECQAKTMLYTLNQGEHQWYQWESPIIWNFFSNQ